MIELTDNLLDEAESFTNNELVMKEDLKRLIKICRDKNYFEEFEQIAFTGKYLNGLLRILESGGNVPEVQSIDHVKNDFAENSSKFKSMVNNIFAGDEKSNEYFEQKYFSLNEQSLFLLGSLLRDLDSIKKYLNHLKRTRV